jgi:hypothetical protein
MKSPKCGDQNKARKDVPKLDEGLILEIWDQEKGKTVSRFE